MHHSLNDDPGQKFAGSSSTNLMICTMAIFANLKYFGKLCIITCEKGKKNQNSRQRVRGIMKIHS
jgi:hypothetical protein